MICPNINHATIIIVSKNEICTIAHLIIPLAPLLPPQPPQIQILLVDSNTALIFWFLFPNGVHRPPLSDKNLFSKLLNFIYRHDHDTNGFPSSHVFSTLIASYFLARAFPHLTPQIISLAILIISGTLFTKQHYVTDIFGGFLWTALSISIST
ncbi:hypothetical protein A2634_02345 [Candidatus Amesbacteria bacterium RIFCSPHIGHO2_01_FULL_48_32]|uniref:Phosphatidic acid phosphatase type 2/haloperoxidase domain-containing protein n=1 Tax=Candidatus Amesbacteria bacterium RIFCSPLOWO2_01_FULL_48_25 TaxID=1797259 RepID=A0A1F4ZE28_9BACT|nr:MAG: hypothetical protein A2634_02345 [Candidatus Amesbacteria bacterium RIFCSPHIGHO2_01_FULL_48_32]OGD04425.1 MAG: hypothetical protein A2989_05350 [Candidatus Amesbacteria bacterium RIFCSPLOWO2_01_FULL_48_25]